MTTSPPVSSLAKASRQPLPAHVREPDASARPMAIFLEGLYAGLLVTGGLLLVTLIALLDFITGPHLSFSVFYLIPVAACAWWGGFPHGILLALAGAVAWNLVEYYESPNIPFNIGVWNGIVRFGTLFLTASLVSRLHAGVLRERLLARTDPLTGAANGRTFYEETVTEVERARRASRPLTLAYFDLDNFKQLNDQLGHAVGDAALMQVVQTVQRTVRNSGLLARLGGDEFALLLPDTGAEEAVDLLSRLQESVTRRMLQEDWPVTLSVGAVTFLCPPCDVDLMIQLVDALMYAVKKQGKGRVQHKTLRDAAELQEVRRRGVEKRATARVLCNLPAKVRADRGNQEEYVTICDISIGGIGLHLDKPLAADTLVLIESLSPGTRSLLARVVHAHEDEGGWKHGCELSARLSPEELRCWLGESLQGSAR